MQHLNTNLCDRYYLLLKSEVLQLYFGRFIDLPKHFRIFNMIKVCVAGKMLGLSLLKTKSPIL